MSLFDTVMWLIVGMGVVSMARDHLPPSNVLDVVGDICGCCFGFAGLLFYLYALVFVLASLSAMSNWWWRFIGWQ